MKQVVCVCHDPEGTFDTVAGSGEVVVVAQKGDVAVEALCQLWCAPGFLKNEWAHAFALLRP